MCRRVTCSYMTERYNWSRSYVTKTVKQGIRKEWCACVPQQDSGSEDFSTQKTRMSFLSPQSRESVHCYALALFLHTQPKP
jgi:hypothetical protein